MGRGMYPATKKTRNGGICAGVCAIEAHTVYLTEYNGGAKSFHHILTRKG